MLQLFQGLAKQQLSFVKVIHSERLSINVQRSMAINHTYHDSAFTSLMRTIILIFILILMISMLIYTIRAIPKRTALIYSDNAINCDSKVIQIFHFMSVTRLNCIFVCCEANLMFLIANERWDCQLVTDLKIVKKDSNGAILHKIWIDICNIEILSQIYSKKELFRRYWIFWGGVVLTFFVLLLVVSHACTNVGDGFILAQVLYPCTSIISLSVYYSTFTDIFILTLNTYLKLKYTYDKKKEKKNEKKERKTKV